MEEILNANTPAKFEARNLRPKFRRLKSGDIFLIELELAEEAWNQLRTVPENALLETVLWWHDGDPPLEQPKPVKESKGPHGAYWHEMFRAGFQNYPDLIEVLDCAGPQIKLRLHDLFQVHSLNEVSPAQFEDFCAGKGLHSLITLSRQAQAKIAA